jgi:hypothetical protein
VCEEEENQRGISVTQLLKAREAPPSKCFQLLFLFSENIVFDQNIVFAFVLEKV